MIMDADRHDGMDCFRLRGTGHDDWPEKTAASIPVNTGATKVCVLHAALEGRLLRMLTGQSCRIG